MNYYWFNSQKPGEKPSIIIKWLLWPSLTLKKLSTLSLTRSYYIMISLSLRLKLKESTVLDDRLSKRTISTFVCSCPALSLEAFLKVQYYTPHYSPCRPMICRLPFFPAPYLCTETILPFIVSVTRSIT